MRAYMLTACAKFDRTNGSMPTDRNVDTGIHYVYYAW